MKASPTPTQSAAHVDAHTAEPWSVSTRFHQGEPREYFIWGVDKIAEVSAQLSLGEEKANAERIVVCVNALQNCNPSAFPDFLKVVQRISERLHNGGEWDDGCFYYEGKSDEQLGALVTALDTHLANLKGAQ